MKFIRNMDYKIRLQSFIYQVKSKQLNVKSYKSIIQLHSLHLSLKSRELAATRTSVHGVIWLIISLFKVISCHLGYVFLALQA